MAREVYRAILLTIGTQTPETGGILLGPVGSTDVTVFYFDCGALCSRATYSPDHVTLNRKMKEEWIPFGIDMKGFVHSHPGELDWVTGGDLEYIDRLLRANPDMDQFAAPIVVPKGFRMRSIVVLRGSPNVPTQAQLVLF